MAIIQDDVGKAITYHLVMVRGAAQMRLVVKRALVRAGTSE